MLKVAVSAYSTSRRPSSLTRRCDDWTAGPSIYRMDFSDAELVERVRAGEVESYRFLVERHYPDCLRYASRMLGNAADAEEAVQDSFERAYRFLNRYDGRRRFKGWLFGILLNRCRTTGASRRRHDQVLISIDALHGRDAPHTQERDFDLDLQRALMAMEPAQREALLLKYADDWTYEEMASATGTGVSALKMRVLRARAQLMKLLQGVYDVS